MIDSVEVIGKSYFEMSKDMIERFSAVWKDQYKSSDNRQKGYGRPIALSIMQYVVNAQNIIGIRIIR